MAMNDDDALERATHAMRRERPSGWSELSDTVRRRVRDLVSPAAALAATTDDGSVLWDERGSTVLVSGRIVVARLNERLVSDERVLDDVRLVLDGERCARVELDLVCSYGTDLKAEAAATRTAARDVLDDLLGPDRAREVVVRIVDVVEHPPTQ